MLRVNKWQMKRPQKLSCGHSAEQGDTAFAVTLLVCEHDLSRTTAACVHALKEMRQESWRPSLLYRLWHFLFGRKNRKTQAHRGISFEENPKQLSLLGQTRYFIARRDIALDCGHTVKSGELYQFTNFYSCEQESACPSAVLLSCLPILPQSSATTGR